jgi:hypothetical protein
VKPGHWSGFRVSGWQRSIGLDLIPLQEARMQTKLPASTVAQLVDIRDAVRSIIPGGRNPEASYHAKDEALRGLARLIGR